MIIIIGGEPFTLLDPCLYSSVTGTECVVRSPSLLYTWVHQCRVREVVTSHHTQSRVREVVTRSNRTVYHPRVVYRRLIYLLIQLSS